MSQSLSAINFSKFLYFQSSKNIKVKLHSEYHNETMKAHSSKYKGQGHYILNPSKSFPGICKTLRVCGEVNF